MKNNIENLNNIFETELIKELLKFEIHKFSKGFKFEGNIAEPGAVPIVIKGSINVSKEDKKGERFTVYNIEQGESCIIALDAIIHKTANRGQEGITTEETETIVISADQSKQWIDKYPSWRKYIFDLYGKRLNDLMQKHEIVSEQNSLITEKNEKIQNSIKYASRIQQAVLPAQEYMKQILPEYFVFNKPRDIVSGDFYWVEEKGNKLIIVVADSTGHGVPGAFMSMLGVSMLNEIINKDVCHGANRILNELRTKIKISLKQTGDKGEQKDGFDMAICIIDTENKTLDFAGAYNPLYLIRNNELIEIKADKMPVGIHVKEKESFTAHQTNMKTDDMIYLFSDGYADQFGYKTKQKFKTKNFKKILLDIHKENIQKQEQILNDTFETWKGGNEQTDDILILGLKIG